MSADRESELNQHLSADRESVLNQHLSADPFCIPADVPTVHESCILTETRKISSSHGTESDAMTMLHSDQPPRLFTAGVHKRVSFAGFVLLALLLVMPAQTHADASRWDASRWQVGPNILVGIPVGDFADVTETGLGFGLRANYELSPKLSLRGDASYLEYGQSRQPFNFGPQIGVLLVETTSQGFRAAAGPQLTLQGESWASYFTTQAGIYLFRANTTIPGTNYSDVSDSNWAHGWNVGGGVQHDIGIGPWVDLSAGHQTIYDVSGPSFQSTDDSPGEPASAKDFTAHEVYIRFGVVFFLTESTDENE